ncbi:Rrf2 family transcriptional regulator, partial [Cellulomonas sp. HZM]|uniref:RrF2 family transcriptional regulator n=1 Tax=Cellulomonas sp. HZM TaxID=1454010 RepID=UPI00049302F8
MRISAKVDYAFQALLHLAERSPDLVSASDLAAAQGLPHDYAETVLGELRKAGYVVSRRGSHGGYQLARPASQVRVGSLVSQFDGPFVTVRAATPGTLQYQGVARNLPSLWGAVDERLHDLLDSITLADVLEGRIPG